MFSRVDVGKFDRNAAKEAIDPIPAYAFNTSFGVYTQAMKGKAEFVPLLTEELFYNPEELKEKQPRAYKFISNYWGYNPLQTK